jgi:hypothetical protein
MRRRFCVLLRACSLALVAASTASASPGPAALALLSDVVHSRDTAVVARFDPQMRASLSATKLRDDWWLYRLAFGRYLGHGPPTVVKLGSLVVVRVPLRMSTRRGEFRVSFAPDGRIAGLYFLRTGVPL